MKNLLITISIMCTIAIVSLSASIIISENANNENIGNSINDIELNDFIEKPQISTQISIKDASSYKYHIINDNEIEENFYKKRIPKEYSDAFLYYTRNNPELRLPFYSIMVHESGNFRVFKRRNTNGSYDLGPSHLNSNNIKNAYFRELYNPKDESHITSVYCFYMVMSLNFFKSLYNKYDNVLDAFYAYNGGEKAPIIIKSAKMSRNRQNFVANVKAYGRAVNNNLSIFEKELSLYKEEISIQISDGLEYFKENIHKYQNYTDVYIVFNESGNLIMDIRNEFQINLLAASINKKINKFACDKIIADRRRDDIFDFTRDEFIIS